MTLKIKVTLLLITSNLLMLVIYLSLADKGISLAYSYTELPQFNQTINQAVELFNKSSDVPAAEKAEFRKSANALMSAYSQREILKEEVIARLLRLTFFYFLPFLVLNLVVLYLLFGRFTAPLNRLARAMEKYPAESAEPLAAPGGRNETAILYDCFAEMKKKIAEYEAILRKEEKISGWVEMSRAIVHELNNFLMPLENYLGSLNHKAADLPLVTDELNQVNRSFAETKSVIANMRNFYSIRQSAPECVNLNDDLAFICVGYQAELESTAGNNIEAVVDRLELNQVIINLIKNGKESVPVEREAQIRVSLKAENNLVFIAVKDNGKGIAQSDQARIFDPGFSSKKNGLGFGLALVQKIVTLNRWEICVESQIDQGSCFTLIIPQK